jgi:hypothetical protein
MHRTLLPEYPRSSTGSSEAITSSDVLALGVVGIVALTLWVWNTLQAESAVLNFEELPPAEIMGLGLGRD